MNFEEHFPFEGPPKVEKPNRRSSTGEPRFYRAKSTDRVFDKPVDLENEAVPGRHDYNCLVQSRTAPFRNKAGFPCYLKTGTPCGMTKEEAGAAWAEARILAERDAKKIMKHVEPILVDAEVADDFPTDIDIARQATLVLLEVIHSPASVRERAAAAGKLLEFYKQKPSTRTESVISTAEMWLDSLPDADDEPAQIEK